MAREVLMPYYIRSFNSRRTHGGVRGDRFGAQGRGGCVRLPRTAVK